MKIKSLREIIANRAAFYEIEVGEVLARQFGVWIQVHADLARGENKKGFQSLRSPTLETLWVLHALVR